MLDEDYRPRDLPPSDSEDGDINGGADGYLRAGDLPPSGSDEEEYDAEEDGYLNRGDLPPSGSGEEEESHQDGECGVQNDADGNEGIEDSALHHKLEEQHIR